MIQIKYQIRAPNEAPPPDSGAEELQRRAEQSADAGEYAKASALYQELVASQPNHVRALNSLGAVLCNLGRFKEAVNYLRRAVDLEPDFPEAYNNLGYALRGLGRHAQAEFSLLRALESRPTDVRINLNLGYTLLFLGRTTEAAARFTAVLEASPGRLDALVGLGHIAKAEGRFADAEALFRGLLENNAQLPEVWASLVSLRRMTSKDSWWLEGAEKVMASGTRAMEEVSLRFAFGKYWDDLDEFAKAFESYRRANELLKATAGRYDKGARAAYVDDLIRVYTRESISQAKIGAPASKKPVFVCGMPRSGTSLVEQIIATHPNARGAGEVGFWTETLFEHVADIRAKLLPLSTRSKLAENYLRVLSESGEDAPRIVDKAPVNSEYLGLIYSVFPNARIIYMRRHPIDTCLSCYFQYLSPAMSYSMDLSDLAHYYREHHRLLVHWRSVLPAGSVLDVPYEELVTNQESWTRRILDFVGLEWNEKCLEFHRASRPVVTSSSWQVRQKIYKGSVGRWRNYEKFLGPLRELSELA